MQDNQSIEDFKFNTVEDQEAVIVEDQPLGEEPGDDAPLIEDEESEAAKEVIKDSPKGNTDTPDDSWLSGDSNGVIKSRADIKAVVEELTQLRAQSQIKPEPIFKTPSQEQVFNFALKYGEGKEMEGAQRFLQVMNIDLGKATETDVLLESFLLENPELSKEQGREVFESMMAEKYPDGLEELPPHRKHEFTKDVTKAKEQISAMQKEFADGLVQKAPEESEAELADKAKMMAKIDEDLSKFKGVGFSIKIGDDKSVTIGPEDGDKESNFSFAVDNIEEFKEIAKNPVKLWEELCVDEKGEFNYNKYHEALFFLKNQNKIIQDIAGHSYDRGVKAQIMMQKGIKTDIKDQQKNKNGTGNELLDGVKKAKAEQGWN